MFFRTLFIQFIGLAFYAPSALAAYGDLLPMHMAPPHSCLIELGNGGVCTGVAMSENVLKTAAHCLRGIPPERMTVTCPGQESVKVVRTESHALHEKANDQRQFDSGLVFTSHKALSVWGRSEWDGQKINRLLQNSICAVWGYGYHIGSLTSVGSYHGVRTTTFAPQEKNLIVTNDYLRFIVKGGDSGGGLFCLEDNQWVNVASVFGHDFEQSYFLRNDKVVDFVRKFYPKDLFSNRAPELVSIDTVQPTPPKVGETYSVLPFSTFHHQGIVRGTGDQSRIQFKVRRVIGDKAFGDLVVNQVSPLRYLCDDIVACRGAYENSEVEISRLGAM